MERPFSTRAMVTAFCFSLLLVQALSAETFITEFGKRRIPLDLIKRALQPHLKDVENVDLSRVVYEIINGNQLVGFDTRLNLKDDTTLRSSSPSKFPKYVLNGIERPLASSSIVRHGKGYTVIHRASDERVMHIFGNGLSLKPLDSLYPDVFVDIIAMDPNRKAATDPTDMAQRIAVKSDFVTSIGNGTVRQSGSCAAGTTHYLELAVAFGNQFCERFSNDEDAAVTAVQTLVSEADEAFREFTCISIALIHIEAHCNDPADPYVVLSDFTRANPGEEPSLYIQRAFGEFWEQSRADVRRDAAYFFSGFEDGSPVAGRAGLGATCNRFAYGWSENLNRNVFVHELGHIVGSSHTADGIMIATGFPGTSIFFSQESIDMITSYVDATDEECLSVSPPLCVNGQCEEVPRASPNPSVFPSPTPLPTGSTGIPVSASPSPVEVQTTTPTATAFDLLPSAIAETATPDATLVPNDLLPNNLTCGGALINSETFICAGSLAEQIEVVFSPERRVPIMVQLLQRNGMFQAILSTRDGSKIRGIVSQLSTKDRFEPDSIGSPTLYEDMPEEVTIEDDAFQIALPAGSSTCCGENLYLHVQLEVCQNEQCVTRGIFTRTTEILCSDPCASAPGGTAVPFSAANSCPRCSM